MPLYYDCEKKIVYVVSPKCGYTILDTLAKDARNKLSSECPDDYNKTTYKAIVIVRDPIKRLMSGFNNWFIRNNKFEVPDNPEWTSTYCKNPFITFREFIDTMIDDKDNHKNNSFYNLNGHFNPQICFIENIDIVRAKFIDISKLSEHLKECYNCDNVCANKTTYSDIKMQMCDVDLRSQNNIPVNESNFIDDDIRNKIYKLYKDDYELFLSHGLNYYDIKSIVLNVRLQNDLELIMNGGFSPLEGFMTEKEYDSVLEKCELLDGSVFSLPINLYINAEQYELIKDQKQIVLKDEQGFALVILNIEDIYKPDLDKECLLAYGTNDDNHPYVKLVYERKNMWYVGGKVQKIQLPRHYDFNNLRKTPEETKKYFKENGWDVVVGFQTRNPMHRSHYELTKYALKQVGENAKLFLNPTVGITQDCDVEYHTRVRCYKEIVKYYDPNQVLLSLLPLSMRMAGPREAVLHAIIRRNYGCTHFIVGRDHAGPSYKTKEGKNFYDPLDAQKFVLSLKDRLGIKIVTSENIVYVKELDAYLEQSRVDSCHTIMNLSGTEQRKLLEEGNELPEWMTFKEISGILKKECMRKVGRCYYFIGLSGAGKSALAEALAEKIRENEPDRTITVLDADIVRQNLSKGLGFSKEDRSTNIRRIGYVASEIVKHGGICIVANIAPYEEDRQFNRNLISGVGKYIQVYVKTSLEVCEERDSKGLYKLARAGVIKNLTGINDPFEEPLKNEFVVDGNDDISSNIDAIYK